MKKDIKRRNELLTKIIKNDNVSILTEEELDELYYLHDKVEPDKDNGIIDIRYEVYGVFIELYGEEVRDCENEITYRIARDSNIHYYDNDFCEFVSLHLKNALLELLENLRLEDLSLEDIESELDKILTYDKPDYNNNFKSNFRSTFPENYDENEDTYIEYLKAYAVSIENAVLDNMVEEHFQDEDEINEDEYNDFQEEVDELYTRLKVAENRLYNFK